MALSGVITKDITGRQYRIEWAAVQNTTGNYSTVTCTHKLVNNSGYDLYISSRSNTCTVDGSQVAFTSAAISTTGGSTITLGTTTHRVNHNADGSKACTITGVFNIQATLKGTYYSNLTATGTVQLDKIPRAAQILSAPDFTDVENPTIEYENTAGAASVQAAILAWSDGTPYAAYRNINTAGGSYTFPLIAQERNTLRAACATANSMPVIFSIKSVVGSETRYSYITKTMSIVNAKPSVMPIAADTNTVTRALTGNQNTIVKGYSNLQYILQAAAQKYASIASYYVKCGSKSAETVTGVLNGADAGTVEFIVTDSRGNTTQGTFTRTFVEYMPPTITAKCGIPNAAGTMAVTVSGLCFNGSFGAQTNTCTVTYKHSTDGGTTWDNPVTLTATRTGNNYSINANITGLDYRLPHTFVFSVTDKLETKSTEPQTVRAFPLFDWGVNDFNFNVPASAQDSVEAYGAAGVIGLDATAGNLSLYAETAGGDRATLVQKTASGLNVGGFPYGVQKVLWSGNWYGNADGQATLSETISSQANGIIIVLSDYAAGAGATSGWSFHFVPKWFVSIGNGQGCYFTTGHSNWSLGEKYLYIYNDHIEGNAANYNNTASRKFAVRYVIGV